MSQGASQTRDKLPSGASCKSATALDASMCTRTCPSVLAGVAIASAKAAAKAAILLPRGWEPASSTRPGAALVSDTLPHRLPISSPALGDELDAQERPRVPLPPLRVGRQHGTAKGLDVRQGFLTRPPVHEHPGKRPHLGNPPPVHLAIELHGQPHGGILAPVGGCPTGRNVAQRLGSHPRSARVVRGSRAPVEREDDNRYVGRSWGTPRGSP